MEHRDNRDEPRDIEVFVPGSVELLDPARAERAASSPGPHRDPPSIPIVALVLFVATCASTVLAGSGLYAVLFEPQILIALYEQGLLGEPLRNGLMYCGAVMLILGAHEMGHYLMARRHHVPASLPYFLPMPLTPIGTMGAVIFQGAHVADRRQMFDIAIAGPLAGLVFALPVAYLGVMDAKVVAIDPNSIRFGDPLILKWMAEHIHGPIGANQDLQIGPLGMAGWVGIFITALNLIPIGQLDGGHILYTLILRPAHHVALALLLGAVGYMVYMKDPSYSLIILLLLIFGPKHPPTANDAVPMGAFRTILGWLTLAFIVVGFTPTPIVSFPG